MYENIKVLSDIHLEHYTFLNDFENIIETNKNSILCLVGDIGNPFSKLYSDFIFWCSKNFLTVFIVAGNHEYYNSTIEKTNKQIENLADNYFNVNFLNNSYFIVDDIIFIGTTLWSYIPNIHKYEIENKINDYRFIQDFNIDISNKIHNDNINFLKSTIIKFKYTHKIIILSHHSPLLKNTSKTEYELLNTNYAFSSDQSLLMKDVNVWIYGHTHYNHKNNYFLYENTYLVCNQYGYFNSLSNNYNKKFSFTI